MNFFNNTNLLRSAFGFLAVLIASQMSSHAAVTSDQPSYKTFQGWVGTPMSEISKPEGKYRIRLLQRYALPDVSPFLVGSLIYVQAPKVGFYQEGHQTYASLEFIRKSMDVKTWNIRKEKTATVFEAYWSKANRNVRIYLQENDKEVSYSIAMVRPGFADSAGIESELMQQQLANVIERKLPWIDNLMSSLESAIGIKKAYAMVDAACLAGCEQYRSLAGQYAVDQCVAQSCPDVPAVVVPPVDTTTNTGTTTTTSTSTTSTTTSNPVESLASLSGSINGATGSIASIAGSMKEYEKLVDPNYLISGTVAVLSTGTVLGAVSSGVTMLADAIVEFVTKSRDTKARSEAFEKAMTEYKKLDDLRPELEKEIDNQLRFLKLAKVEAGSTENLLYFSRFTLARDKAKLKKLSMQTDKALEAGTSPEDTCLVNNFAKQAELETRISQMETVVKTITPSDAMPSLCAKAALQIKKLSEMEEQMQRFHSNLLNGVDVWVKHWDKEFQNTIKQSDQYEKRLKTAKKQEEKGAEKSKEMLAERLKKDKALIESETYARCYSKLEPFWNWVPGLGYLVTGKSRKTCRDLATSPESESAIKFKKRADDLINGIKARQMDQGGSEGVFGILAKQAHAGDFRPGFEVNSLAFADQKEWLKKIAQDHSIENLGTELKAKKTEYKIYCDKK